MKEKPVYEGVISATQKGMGFFVIPTGSTERTPKDRDKSGDVFIPAEAMNHALHGDIVKVEIVGESTDPKSGKRRPEGKVLEIVSRARETFVGKLVEEAGKTYLLPDYKKMYTPIEIAGAISAPLGYKAVVRLDHWNADAAHPVGHIEEVIGEAGVHETEMRALALGQGFHSDFPPGVVEDAEKLEAEGKKMIAEEVASGRRRDFRKIPTSTIAPFDAKDFDDALSVQKLANGNIEVGVHIADVSFFVKPGSAIDDEARERATSVYLVDRTIPMLPEVLSNDLCSLRPNEDRLSISAVFTLDGEANIVDQWFGETIIHSAKRFTYEEAQEVLDKGQGTLYEELATLPTLSKKIRVRRQANGAIEFDTAEVKVELDETGKPIAIRLKERKETNLLIEDFMLLANEAVAEHISKLAGNGKHAYIYRVHDTPDADRIEKLALFLRVLGYDLKTHAGGRVTGTDLNALLEQVKGKPEEYLIKTATLRSMAKAVYATKNIGHFGLAFAYYTHFTSPIRRYPDLLVHRIIKHHSGGEPISDAELNQFDQLAVHSSEREVGAAEAERDSIKMKQVEYMTTHLGEEFDAVISGVSDRGLYIEEKLTHSDGMISIRGLGDDYFEYDERHYRLVGRRTKKTYQLGDPVRVKLIAARIPEKELDFTLLP